MSIPRIDAIYPLTPLQQGMLFHCLKEPEAAHYWTQYVCMLHGRLDVAAFKEAWRVMLRRHTVLRTAFVWENRERPLQVVLAEVPLPWEELDWSQLSPAGQSATLDAILRSDLEQGCELTKAPLLRLRVAKLGPDLHQLVWSHHHLLFDGWSLQIVLKELLQVYDARVEGRELELPPARPFRDYLVWHQQQTVEKSEPFWRNLLRGFTAPTPLVMADLPGIPAAKEDYAIRKLSLSDNSTRALQDLARRHHLTLNTLMQGSWALLLSRYSGENDVIYGVTVSGRAPELPGVLSMVGMFINTLPFLVRIDPEQPLLEWLKTLQDSQVELRQHDLTPLVQAHAWSDVPHGTPLFNCVLVFENYPVDEFLRQRAGKLAIGEARFIERPNLPLAALVFAEERLTLQLIYQTCRFDGATVERIIGHWSTLLESMVASPESRLRALPWITGKERRQLLTTCNETGPIYPQDKCIHELFESQVRRAPGAVAVVCEDQSLTYRQLNARANQLAHMLRAMGVERETAVGLYMERSVELMVGLIAILKAGGTYVPIDPSYPADRTAFILEDTRAPVVLTQRALQRQLQTCGTRVLCIDDPALGLESQPTADPSSTGTAASTIYIIYTSGSTGRPKGCCITHENVSRLFQSTELWFGFNEKDVWTMFHSCAFDFSVWEIWGALLYGGKLIVVPYLASRSPQIFGELLARERVTVLNQTPSAFKQLMAATLALPITQALSLRYVIFGGESLDIRSLKPWFDVHGDECPRLVNMYGITETTVHVTYRPLNRNDIQGGSVIGVAIPDLRVYVLDSEMNPCPVGVSGEMYVGGAGVARGYLDRDELTAERFLPSPFVIGDRLYRTGDLARWLPDRDLEYLGRIDQQVKIRGFRIELAEIESVLGTHSEVGAGVVVPQDDGAGGKSLTAFVVPRDAAGSLSVEALRAWLGKKLPDYMVPSRFVVVATLPLTTNGKLDRRALETIKGDVLGASSCYVAPRTELECQLAMVWQEVLRQKQVGLKDDFFTLGGHSLLAITIASKSSSLLGRSVPLRWIFEHPTVEGLARQIDLAAPVTEALPCITRANRQQPIPMSFGQQRMWLLQQTLHASATYHIPVAYHFRGRVDAERLQRALHVLMMRHEVLRTALVQDQGGLVQRISNAWESSLPWHEMDLSAEPKGQRQALVEKLLADEAHRPFDLGCAPLWRVLWLRLGSEENILAVTFHHGVMDEWSLRFFFTEWARTYAEGTRFDATDLADLSDLPLQYADFAVWQRQQLSGAGLAREESYWRERLQALPPPLEMHTDRTRSLHRDGKGAGFSFELSSSLTDSLRSLARREGVSLFSLLLAAFQVWLHRYSGRDDLIVGVPVANREHPEVQTMLGFFLNTVPLRVQLERSQSFRTVLRQVQSAVSAALDHAALPFEQIVALATKGREGSQTPLYQVMFVLVEEGLPDWRLDQLATRVIPLRTATSKCDLVLSLNTEGSIWAGELEYATELHTEETVASMAIHLEELLFSIAANPDENIGRLNLLPAEELHQLVVELNNTAVEYPSDQCIQSLFEAQVERMPDALAVLFEDQSLTYRELNLLANRLAHHLRSLDVGPEVPVGLCVERSPAMLVGLLGILKAGGAYVPLSPTFPGERLAFYLHDSRARIIVTQASLRGMFSAADSPHLVILEDLPETGPATNPAALNRPSDLAYVIYTSGSTGVPKGVAIEHRNTVSFLNWVRDSFTDEELAGVLASTSICFDLSVYEILGTLSWGGLVILVEDILASGASPHWPKVRLINTVPSLMEAVLKNGTRPSLPMTVNLAGEALSTALVEAIGAAWPVRRINDLYGPTETTTYSTWATRRPREAATIGRPLANTQVYLVDVGMQPVPRGFPGELVIAGAGVARGYLHRPELTCEKFVPNPFSHDANARIYRTGDLARWRQDGTLEYLGRMDQQVKIRGFRIELGEVEAVLGEHSDVSACAVVAQDDDVGGKILTAFLVSRDFSAVDAEHLRSWLTRKLPGYMVPSRFVALAALPLTPNGKLDRKALEKMEGEAIESTSCHLEPRNELEQELAGIWADVLRLEKVGVADNFFVLGGHSLLALAVVSRLCSSRSLQVPLRWIFEHPTVEALARQIESGSYGLSELQPIPIADRCRPVPMSFGQQRMWLVQQTLAESATYHVPVAYQLDGPIDTALLRECLVKIMERHEVLRTEFVQAGGTLIQRIHSIEEIALPWTEKDFQVVPVATRAAAVASCLAEEAARPFDLSKAPLWRVRWMTLAEQSHLMALTFHHGVMDEWSLRLLFKELEQLYAAGADTKTALVPALWIQYADYAVWQREQLTGELLARDQAYWREQLKSLPPSLELSTAGVRPARRGGRGGICEFELSVLLTEGLRGLAQQEKASLFKVLLAAFQVWLHRYSGQEDIIVGTPVTNRERPETQSLIGFFLNTLPIRTRLGGTVSFRQLLRQVRDTVEEAMAHAALPFEQMVEITAPGVAGGQTPLYQTMLVLVEEGIQPFQLGNITACAHPIRTATAKCDLLLSMNAEGSTWKCELEYAEDLFTAESAARMVVHLEVLLGSIVVHPDKAIGCLNMLPDDERHRVLVGWNDTQREYPKGRCVHPLFEEQVERTPDAVAVSMNQQSVTYRELNRRANQLAHHLRTLGVGPDLPVGLCIERSVDMVVAVLGILKAGGAYVPLDPSYPSERLAYMIQSNGNTLVVTQTALVDLIPDGNASVFLLDDVPAETCGENPPLLSSPGNLAYILYTSGSTGQPKGVAMEHGPLVNLMQWEVARSKAGQRVLQFASLNFDVSFQEMFSTWLSGGTLVLVDSQTRLDPAALWEHVVEQNVERVFLPVVMLQYLAEESQRSMRTAPKLLEVITAGEQLRITPVIRGFFRSQSGRTLHNHYGPTESHVVTSWTLPASPVDWPDLPSIGTPIANTCIYLLDSCLNPVPAGTPGEIYIGGVALARGYWNQPQATHERFVADPFAERPGARMYRTGDVGRHLPDGCIAYLGRTDHQVKIRGFRVELGEVESVLGMHPEVRAGVAVVQSDSCGVKNLVVFVVPGVDAILSAEVLRSWLVRKLPDYMIPSRFAILKSLPLTSNGKLDRKALEKMDGVALAAAGAEYVPPGTAVEHQLAHIWQEVLNLERVGVSDDFFELGGHSLLVVRMLGRIQDETGVMLSLRGFFAEPRIRPLARLLEVEKCRIATCDFNATPSSVTKPPLFLLGWLLNLESAGLDGHPSYVIPFPTFEHSREECRVEYLAGRCLERLRAIQPHGPYMLVGYSLAGPVAFEMACRLKAEGEDVPLVAIIDTAPPSRLHRLAPVFLGSVGSLLGLDFRLEVSLARLWFYLLDKPRHLVRLLGPDRRHWWQVVRSDFKRLSKLWHPSKPRSGSPVPATSSQRKADAFFGARGFGVFWPHMWALCAYRPKFYDGFVGLFVTEATQFERSEPGRGWGCWAPRLREYSLPGDHNTCVTTHKEILESKLREAIAEAATQPRS